MHTTLLRLARGVGLVFCLLGTDLAAETAGRVFPYRWETAPPASAITIADLQQALTWTGHFTGPVDGAMGAATRDALAAWQAARKLVPGTPLSPQQSLDLVTEGLKQRDAVKWALLVDDGLGYSIGVPTALTELQPPAQENGRWWTRSSGPFALSVSARPMAQACTQVDAEQKRYAGITAPDRKVLLQERRDDGFVVAGERGGSRFFTRSLCRDQGLLTVVASLTNARAASQGAVLAATANSVTLRPSLAPTARPAPRLEPLPPPPAAAPSAPAAPGAAVDHTGKTAAITFVLREASPLRPEEVFERVAPAVWMVRVPRAQGSAVAISATDLLTNCHVVGKEQTATIEREGDRREATVVTANERADRCVLRVGSRAAPLPRWVRVRPWADVKVGEPAYTVGAPKGYELSLADGIVSSKRTMSDEGRVIQTSAPISHGSSGGGLFDSRGNLLGITTFMLKDAQNLNFAIAAEEYAR